MEDLVEAKRIRPWVRFFKPYTIAPIVWKAPPRSRKINPAVLKEAKKSSITSNAPPDNQKYGDEDNLRCSWPKIIIRTPSSAPVHTAIRTVIAAERGSKSHEIGV